MTITFSLTEDKKVLEGGIRIAKSQDRNSILEEAEESYQEEYSSLFSLGFDMQRTITSIPRLNDRIEELVELYRKKPLMSDDWSSGDWFESVCMDLIEQIVARSRDWHRAEAIQEAAKELAAVDFAHQSRKAHDVHARVLHEFIICSESEYEILRKSIFGEE